MKEQKRRNNKGFSLVELIVVIAIMAVLVGILAPQFIKYVDKSRRSTDIKNMQEYVAAIQTYAADNDALKGGTITLTKGGAASIVETDTTNKYLTAALADAGITPAKMGLSSGNWGTIVVTVTFDTNNTPVFTSKQTSAKTGDDYDFAKQCGFQTTP